MLEENSTRSIKPTKEFRIKVREGATMIMHLANILLFTPKTLSKTFGAKGQMK